MATMTQARQTAVPAVYRGVDAAAVETNRKRRTVRAIWSAQTVDHYNTLFLMDGIDTSSFDKNPVILAEHGKSSRGMKPVATAREYGVDTFRGMKVFVGTAKWWEGDSEADDLFSRYASGELRGWSISAKPIEVGPSTAAERRLAPDMDQCVEVMRRLRLLEVSCCAVPGNEHTLTLSVERSLAAYDHPELGDPNPHVRFARLCKIEAELGRAEHQEAHRRLREAVMAGTWRAGR
jgi:hypothetical protein